MKYIAAFFAFWYHFIVGDDWIIAALVIAAVALTVSLVRVGWNVWWLMPVATLGALAWGVWRSLRNRQQKA